MSRTLKDMSGVGARRRRAILRRQRARRHVYGKHAPLTFVRLRRGRRRREESPSDRTEKENAT